MQSVDLAPVDGDSAAVELSNDNDVVVESKTLPELSNDAVMATSGEVSDNDNDNDNDNDGNAVVIEPKSRNELSDEVVLRKSGDEGEGLGVEEGEEDMEVNFVEKSGKVVFEGEENTDLRAVSDQSKHSDDFGSEEGNQGSSGKARFDSSAQNSSPNLVNEVNEETSTDGNQATGNVKETIRDNVTDANVGKASPSKGVSRVLDFDSNVVSRGKKSKTKGGFRTSDLIWGKVRSHPWWPAQIFDLEDGSKQAKKHFKSKTYLLAYFGDKSFAWNEEAKIKPFAPHFPQMVKQSTADAFQDAVDCALDEAARRAEFGLSCHCIADDVYSRLKIQVIKNAGVRKETRVQNSRDRLYNASTLEPVKFLDYVKRFAQVPHVEENVRLEHVVVHAQMSAFYRWKGIYHLAEFGLLKGYVNNEADAPVNREKEETPRIINDRNVVPEENMKNSNRPQKRKKISGDKGNSTKKLKPGFDSVRKKSKKNISKEDDDDEEEMERKAIRKLVSSSVKRHKEGKMSYNESKSKDRSNTPQITPSRESKPSGLRVGESMLRAALQLSQSSPILKPDVSSQGKTTKKSSSDAIPFKKSSSDAILSKLLLTAVDPLKDHVFLSSMISFFSDFRDSVVQDIEFLVKHEESGSEEMAEEYSSGNKVKQIESDCEITISSDKIIKIPEDNPEHTKADDKSTVIVEHCLSETVASESGDSIQDESPTALTLKFTDMDSIPTEEKLNKIFSAFGPLKVSETDVLAKKKSARVVFRRRTDAETAFSSSGKFKTFGASLVCYQLNYAPSPRKSTSPEAKRRKKDGTLVEGISA